ncbi:MAG: low molecular weight phosphotyrosine protein phosphatase [Cyclobacteriaceae bacterium]|nr:low molecular weight phosphotyrosine protein phosphatase [Cyclobacteriaceae bacterium]
MVKVLFVCLGNICRSPLAEGVFKHIVTQRGLQEKIIVKSAGTSGWHLGEPPDPRSVTVARNHGIVLDSLGRKAISEDFETYDYIIAMDKSNFNHLQNLRATGGTAKAKLLLMRDFDEVGKGLDVPDPYYGGDDGFDKVYQMLDRSCRKLLDEIVKQHDLK